METLLRARVGTVDFPNALRPLWLEVVRDRYGCRPPNAPVKYCLSFDPMWDILPMVRMAEPESIIVEGSAFKSRLSLRVSLYYSSLEGALKAVDRLSRAGVLKGVPDIRRAILRNIGTVYPEDIPKELLGFLSSRVPSFTRERPEEVNYLQGVDLLDPRQRGKWLLRFGELPIEKLKRAVLLSYILDKGWRREEKKQWLIKNGYSEAELRARKIAHELLEERWKERKKE